MEWLVQPLRPFLQWLWQTTLIASLVIVLILVAQKALADRLDPRWSHALWLVLLIRMVLPWAPASQISLLNLLPSSVRQGQPPTAPLLMERGPDSSVVAVPEAAGQEATAGSSRPKARSPETHSVRPSRAASGSFSADASSDPAVALVGGGGVGWCQPLRQ